MRKGVCAVVLGVGVCLSAGVAVAKDDKKGEELFQQKCMACHPDGGNIINQKKTLKKQSLAASGIKNSKAMVDVMRKPGPGMPKYNKGALSDKDATAIADYILKTFK